MKLKWTQKIILRRLLKKESPDRYTTSVSEEEQMNYDFMYVLGSTNEHKDALFLSWDESKDLIKYMWWPEDADGVRGTEATCASSDLIWDTLSAKQRYRTWDTRYSTIREAYLYDVFHLQLIKWRIQKIRNIFLRPVTADHRMPILKTIIKMYDNQEPITTNELLAKIHGSAIRLSGEYYRLQKNLEFIFRFIRRLW
jgi:hypothetical protein